MNSLKIIALDYFQQNPSDKDFVLKAYYAYHCIEDDGKSHNFTSGSPESKCIWCQRTRVDVRWDDLPYECLHRKKSTSIENVISEEESKYFDLLKKSENEIPKIIKRLGGLNGKTLSIIHHTYGYDPEVVAGVVELDDNIMIDYYQEMEKERELSRSSNKKLIIIAK